MQKKKAYDNIRYPFMILKNLQNIAVERNFLNSIKGKNATANILLNGERLNAFSLRLGTRQGSLLPSLLFSMVLEVLENAIRQEKGGKGT